MMLHPLPASVCHVEEPQCFTFPFAYQPHPLCVAAAGQLRQMLAEHAEWAHELAAGKMMGVLVARTPHGQRGWLAAFSGTLGGRQMQPGFVPPVYHSMAPGSHFATEEAQISQLGERIAQLQAQVPPATLQAQAQAELQAARHNLATEKARRDALRRTLSPQALIQHECEFVRQSQHQKAEYKRLQRTWRERIEEEDALRRPLLAQIEALDTERRTRSRALQDWLFAQYHLRNAQGESCALPALFAPQRPPAGAGDCCAPKLLQAAYSAGLRPLCMAEFWVGASPADELRADGHFYPACRSKCRPILPFMLQGLQVEPNPLAADRSHLLAQVRVICATPEWAVLCKPAGLLSVPGRDVAPCILHYVRRHFAQATGPIIVHRLDMDTSGLMVVALTPGAYHQLQDDFLHHRVAKTYLALLERPMPVGQEGSICLPLCTDPADRPRQRVSHQHGRAAHTTYRVLACPGGHALLALVPHTGRTHQLRVHCAHPQGLDNPIVGDRLYGHAGGRLMLHAAKLSFGGHHFCHMGGLGDEIERIVKDLGI